VLQDGQRICFRLPTGGDLEDVAGSGADPEHGALALLERCVLERSDGAEAGPLPVQARDELPRRMADLDPQAEITIVMSCPDCGADVRAGLDAAGTLLDELVADEDELYREIHSLALHYHWSERDILALEVPDRRRYLGLLAASLGAEA
jgi:hypothetical protein